jgi:hypothetical protein
MDRGRRRKPLSSADQDRVVRRLELAADEIADIGDLIGSAYGAAWCNKALKLHRSVHRLRQEVIDHYDDLLIAGGMEDATNLVLTTERQRCTPSPLDWRARYSRR